MGICSLVLHTRPEKIQLVLDRIEALEGVEVHAVSGQGKLVVCVDRQEPLRYSETIMQLHNLSGVLSAALVYEYNDESSITHREVST